MFLLPNKGFKETCFAQKAMASLMSIVLGVGLSPSYAFAKDTSPQPSESPQSLTPAQSQDQGNDVYASGTWGSCPWELSDDGVLTIGTGIGAEASKIPSPWTIPGDEELSPWDSYKDRITSISCPKDSANVTAPRNCFCLFKNLNKLQFADLSGFDTSNTWCLDDVFNGCSSLTSLNLSEWNTSNVSYMQCLFAGCSSLTSLVISKWDVSKAKYMNATFSGCSALTSLDLSGWNTKAVEYMNGMLRNCTALQTIYVGDHNRWTTDGLRPDDGEVKGRSMFANCTSLVGANGTSYDADHIDADYARIDTPSTPGYLTAGSLLPSGTWGTCPWEISDDGVLTIGTGTGAEASETPPIIDIDVPFIGVSPWRAYRDLITSISCPKDSVHITAPGNCLGLFRDLNLVQSVDLSGFDTSNVWCLYKAFDGCTSLSLLDLSEWDTSNLEYSDKMFRGCTSLKTIYVRDYLWSTAKVTSSSDMFTNCTSLVGGSGTVYDAAHKDIKYARIDTPDTPGYLTSLTLASGKWGTCTWDISFEGILEIKSGTGDNTGGVSPWEAHKDQIVGISCPAESTYIQAPNDCSNLFSACSLSGDIDLTGWDMSQVTNMSGMFSFCHPLTSFETFGWDTSQVENMEGMFDGCTSLSSLDLSAWDTLQVTNMVSMFNDCRSLTYLNFAGWNTSQVENMEGMFSGCMSLPSLDLSAWDTSQVANMVSMFNDCRLLKYLNFAGWDTSQVDNMTAMFSNCFSLERISVSDSWVTGKLTSSLNMFSGCLSLVGRYGTEYDPNHTNGTYAHVDTPENPGYLTIALVASGLWGSCPWELDVKGILTVGAGTGVDTGGISPWEAYRNEIVSVSTLKGTSRVQAPKDCTNLFKDFGALASINISTWDTSRVEDMSALFSGCHSLTFLDIAQWDTSRVKDTTEMFSNCDLLAILNISSWNTSSLTDTTSMFSGCSALTSLDLNGWNTSQISNLTSMFSGCSSLAELSVSNWDTSSVKDMSRLFYGCASLVLLNIADWNTSSVINMSSVFEGCRLLEGLSLSDWDTSQVENMLCMFYDCRCLTSLHIADWDTAQVMYAVNMFYNCASLATLDLAGWDTSCLVDTACMFKNCSSLKSIYVGDGWSTQSLISSASMFLNCVSLVGGNNTSYDASHTDGQYARIDTPRMPGYFTGSQIFVPAPQAASGLVYTGGILTGVKADTGYTVTGGTAVNAGSYQATATLEEGYEWEDGDPSPSKTLTWQISPANLAKAKITLSATSFTYNGKVQKPSLKKVALGNKVLSASNYTAVFPSSKNVGTYTVRITGLGNYTDITTATYKVLKAPTIKVSKSSKTVSAGTLAKKAQSFNLGAKANSNSKITYKIVKKNNKITFKNGKLTLKKGTKAGTYKATIRVNVAAKGASGASFKNFTVKFVVKK